MLPARGSGTRAGSVRVCTSMTPLRTIALTAGLTGAWLTFAAPAAPGSGHAGGSPAAQPVTPRVTPVAVHLGPGRSEATLTLRRPVGAIVVYRIRAASSARVAATVQRPGVSAPLQILTGTPDACSAQAGSVTCSDYPEACPMPAGAWRLHVRKLGGPAGRVTVWFEVGVSRSRGA